MPSQEIMNAYLENLNARKESGFARAEGLAIEDTAYLLDISIKDVCLAISANR